ncbi:MAG: ATP-binding protein [Pseudonocardiaceae bacterium]
MPSLDQDNSVRLFVERAAQVRPRFALDPAETEIVAEICRRLDGIPLAIELAAARVRMMHPARIIAALDDRFRPLTGGDRTAMPRQQTIEASVAWSHDLLDDDEQALLHRLSIFAGGCTLDAAERVCATDPLDAHGVLDLLSRLVDKSLVQVVHITTVEDRYRLLETIRLYAHQRLVESGEADATEDRHAEFFLDLAERAEPELAASQGPMWLVRLEREHDNIRAALEHLDTTGADESFLCLVTALTLFWELRGHLREGGRWFARALARDDEPSSIRARALWGATHVAMYSDDFGTAAHRGPQALAMAEAIADEWATARALSVLSYMQLFTNPEAARVGLARSIDLSRKIGDNWGMAYGLKMITVAWLMQEDHAEIRRSADELLRVAEPLDNKFFLGWYHCLLGGRACIAASSR